MFLMPKKFHTVCTVKGTDTVVFDRLYEAINRDEAEARAYLNCVKEHKGADVLVRVERR